MSWYRKGEMAPRDCEECGCQQWRWNAAPSALRTDPPSTCTCGHPTARHRFRPYGEEVDW